MKCNECKNWIIERKTIYDDGLEVINYVAHEGKGRCEVLSIDTTPDFGCLSFIDGDHIVITYKAGAPWQYWYYDTCPECNGRGSKPPPNEKHCSRCIGIGNVRYYEDGYIGEERTKLHPKEKEAKAEEVILKKIENGKSGVL